MIFLLRIASGRSLCSRLCRNITFILVFEQLTLAVCDGLHAYLWPGPPTCDDFVQLQVGREQVHGRFLLLALDLVVS